MAAGAAAADDDWLDAFIGVLDVSEGNADVADAAADAGAVDPDMAVNGVAVADAGAANLAAALSGVLPVGACDMADRLT